MIIKKFKKNVEKTKRRFEKIKKIKTKTKIKRLTKTNQKRSKQKIFMKQ